MADENTNSKKYVPPENISITNIDHIISSVDIAERKSEKTGKTYKCILLQFENGDELMLFPRYFFVIPNLEKQIAELKKPQQ